MLLQFPAGELTHVKVPPGAVSRPSRVYPSSEWYFVVGGRGQLWSQAAARDSGADLVDLLPDRCVRIAPGTPFQYRADDDSELEIVLAVMPQWRPAYHGVLPNGGFWPTTASSSDRLDTRGTLLPASAMGVEVHDPDPALTYLAPDGSTVMTLGSEPSGGLALCTLDAGRVSAPIRHQSVEELWYVISGSGEIGRRHGARDPFVDVLAPGVCADVGTGLTFQFRSAGPGPLRMLLLTMPQWPGANEAVLEPVLAIWGLGE